MNGQTRTTISLPPETLEVFRRMAASRNMSVSRCMGEWLRDTSAAAEMVSVKMEEAKKEPMRIVEEMSAMIASITPPPNRPLN